MLAVALTMAVPMLVLLCSPTAVFPLEFALTVSVICVGIPAWFGITFLLIPVERLLQSYGTSLWVAAAVAVAANCLFVAVIGWMLPADLKQHSDYGYPEYLGFAAYAAIAWLACEHLFRRISQSA